MLSSLGVGVLLVAAATGTGDPLAPVRHAQGKTFVQCSGALETVMLLSLLASPIPSRTEFQAQARAQFAIYAGHPAVHETAALMGHGFLYRDLARLSTFMSPAPYFLLVESGELAQLAEMLPANSASFNLDRLHGYAKLVREFYWDNHVGRFLRKSLPFYQNAVRRPLPPDLPPGARVLLSPLAPAGRLEFQRRGSVAVTYVVLDDADAR